MYIYIKRFLDIVFSVVFLVVFSPFLLIIGLAVRLGSRGPALFRQERIGRDGKIFRIFKFRSMTVGAEGTGSGVYSCKGDPRVTKIGRFLRALSLDELPQLFNILAGQMSFIGPRPVLTYHPWPLAEYTEEQLGRFSVRPGITGLAQVNGRKQTPWVKRIEFDLLYVKKISFITDMSILFSTVFKVFKSEKNLSEQDAETGKALATNLKN